MLSLEEELSDIVVVAALAKIMAIVRVCRVRNRSVESDVVVPIADNNIGIILLVSDCRCRCQTPK